jgi:hypothetical protein
VGQPLAANEETYEVRFGAVPLVVQIGDGELLRGMMLMR